MNIIREKIYWPVIFSLIIQLFVSSEIFWVLGLVTLIYILFHENFTARIPFKEYSVLFAFLMWGIILGSFIIGEGDTSFRDYLRDIFYYTTPMIYIYIGAYYARKGIAVNRILNSFIISSAIISFVYLIRIYQQGAIYLLTSDIHGWRSLSGGGAIVIGVALAIMLSGLISEEDKLPKTLSIICFSISGLFFVLSLSRTNLIIIIIMTIVLSVKRTSSKKTIKRFALIVFTIIAVIGLSSVLLPAGFLRDYVEKIFNSLTEISVTNNWNATTIQANWRGYENYCAIEQWRKSSLIEQMIGSGFGKRIYVGNYAYLFLEQLYSDGTAANSIAVLHNGYTTQLIKLGILGVAIYILFYILIIKNAIRTSKTTKSLESRLFLAVGVTLLFQTYFLNGLFRDYCYYPLILLIGYTAFRSNYEPERCKVLI